MLHKHMNNYGNKQKYSTCYSGFLIGLKSVKILETTTLQKPVLKTEIYFYYCDLFVFLKQ
jgi:hypothetical protein